MERKHVVEAHLLVNGDLASIVLFGGVLAWAVVEVILMNRADARKCAHIVLIENEIAAAEACFMLRRAGCKRLAVVSSTAGTPSIVAREEAFVAAAREAGVEAVVSRAGPTGYAAGAESARQLLAGSKRPDGVFCATDLLALGFLDAARIEFKLSLPQDIRVVGFDDINAAGWLGYDLTTFRQPLPDRGPYRRGAGRG